MNADARFVWRTFREAGCHLIRHVVSLFQADSNLRNRGVLLCSCVYNLMHFITNVTEYCNVWVYLMTHLVTRRDSSPVWNSGLQVGPCGSTVG
jgi:hypothetical protein